LTQALAIDAWAVPAFLVVGTTLVAVSVVDVRRLIVPNRILLPMTGVSVALFGLAAIVDGKTDHFLRSLACGTCACVVFCVLHVAAPRGLGLGDVKLAFLLGLTLGWISTAAVVVGFMLGFVLCAAVGTSLIATGIRSRSEPVPFAPFLAAGTLISFFVMNQP
jgi:leader peptidase (prepilin peptidase) / N-methyltransferase